MHNSLPGGYSVLEPPDPISNSDVKRLSADDSVGFPHAKVGHCQALIRTPSPVKDSGFFIGMVKPFGIRECVVVIPGVPVRRGGYSLDEHLFRLTLSGRSPNFLRPLVEGFRLIL